MGKLGFDATNEYFQVYIVDMDTSAVNTNRILKTLSIVFYKCLGPIMNLTNCLCVMINDIDFVLESDTENLKFGLP